MKIRRATSGDAAGIAAVQVQSWHETYTGLIPQTFIDSFDVAERTTMWEEILERADGATESVWVAVEEAAGSTASTAVVGFASTGPSRFDDYAPTGELTAIYLLAKCHGRGVGKQLFQRAAAALAAGGHDQFVVRVLLTNPAFGFYTALGGEVLGEYDEMHAGTALPHAVMQFSTSPEQ